MSMFTISSATRLESNLWQITAHCIFHSLLLVCIATARRLLLKHRMIRQNQRYLFNHLQRIARLRRPLLLLLLLLLQLLQQQCRLQNLHRLQRMVLTARTSKSMMIPIHLLTLFMMESKAPSSPSPIGLASYSLLKRTTIRINRDVFFDSAARSTGIVSL